MNNLKKLIDMIERSKLIEDAKKYKRSAVFHQLQMEVSRIFVKALKNIKPIKHPEKVLELFDNKKPWTNYAVFDYTKYIKEVDSKFDQLNRKLKKENILLTLEYSMTYNEFWTGFRIDLSDNESDNKTYFDSELYLDKIFYNIIQDMIYSNLIICPIMIQLGMPRLPDSVELKALSFNWDT